MHPVTLLAIVAGFAGFLLKTSFGLCVCWALSKVVVSPKAKFLIWLGFLVGAACYWLWLVEGFVPDGVSLAPFPMPMALAMAAPVGKWQVQPSWAIPLSIVLRGLGVLYLLVLARLLFARIKKQVHLRWVLRFAYRAPEDIENFFQRIAEGLDAGNVRLLVLSGIHSPATFGWRRPTVLLSPFCLEQDLSELSDIFRHELQHVRRRDFAFNTVASLCRALLFFHPAAWYAMRRLELEGELACDLAVVGDSPERRATYAECLVRFARRNIAEGAKPWNLDFAGSSVQIKVRIRSVLAGAPKIPSWLRGMRAALGLLLFAGFLGVVPSLFIALSYEQHRVAQPEKPTSPAVRTDVRLPRRGIHKIRLQEQATRTNNAFPTAATTTPTAAPVEAAVDATPVAPRKSEPILSNEPLPTLKRRGDGDGVAPPETAPTIDIPISTPRSSHPVITKGRVTASAILAGAIEAVRIASHDHDGDDH